MVICHYYSCVCGESRTHFVAKLDSCYHKLCGVDQIVYFALVLQAKVKSLLHKRMAESNSLFSTRKVGSKCRKTKSSLVIGTW